MAGDSEIIGTRRGSSWRVAGWGVAVLLLLLPFVAMQFTSDVNWTAGDFIFAALLIGVVGLTLELVVRASSNWAYRLAAGLGILASFLTVWINGAVGMIGSEENPYNLLFLAVVPLALLGAVLARFRPAGMAIAMTCAGIAQAALGIVGMSADLRGGILSTLLAGAWLLSAVLFRYSGTGQQA